MALPPLDDGAFHDTVAWALPAVAVTPVGAPGAVVADDTVISAVPVLASDLASIVATPALRPVTRPVEETLARAGAVLAQVTVRPLRVLPLASLTVADSWTVWPSVMVAVDGVVTSSPL